MKQNAKKQKRSALVTGATGFVGYALTERLLREHWEVHLLVREGSDLKKLEHLSPSPRLRMADGSIASAIEIIRQAKPEVVFHLASEVLAKHEPGDLEPLIRSNILLGTQLLEAMVKTNTRYFVNTGTFWQYCEGEEYSPVNLYAATKQAFEDILRYYTQNSSIHAITLKLFDVYGPGDGRNKLFNLLEETYRTGRVLPMTPGHQKMDLVYIDDVVHAFVRAAEILLSSRENGIHHRSFAVSSSRHIPLREVVEIYKHITGRPLNIRWGGRPYRDREVMKPWKGNPLPGWRPAVNLDAGIRLMVSQESLKRSNRNGENDL